MYDYFNGKVAELSPTQLILEVGGIGYCLNISLQTYSLIAEQSSVKIFVYQYNMRDDLPVMYGFYTKQERSVFCSLIDVSGVGGNTARTILSTFSPIELGHIISVGDAATLKKVKGLGQKTAEKVIVELRDKISTIIVDSGDGAETLENAKYDMSVAIEAINALQMLGFNRVQSEKVVKSVVQEYPNEKIEKVIKLSLKRM